MTRHLLFLILVLSFLSCDNHEKENIAVVKQIVDAVDASTVEVKYESTAIISGGSSVIELVITNCKALTDNGTNEFAIAGLAARITFENFHPQTIQDKAGVKVTFLPKQYSQELYFSSEDLSTAKDFTKNISTYLYLLSHNDTIHANDFISNSHYDFSISEFHRAVKNRLKTPISKITHMYDVRDFSDKNEKSYKAYSILTIINFVDNSFVKIDFGVPLDNPDKIITVHFRD